MRLLSKDLKHKKVRLRIEDNDDLWYLSTIISPGDLVGSLVERKINLSSSDEKSRTIRKKVFLMVRVEKITFKGSEIRIKGLVEDGTEDIPKGSTQGFSLGEGDELLIIKEWNHYILEKLDESIKDKDKILVCLFDRTHANIYVITNKDIDLIRKKVGNLPKKQFNENKQNNFYKDLINELMTIKKEIKPSFIVFASPAFWQEYLKKELDDADFETFIMTTVSDIDKNSINELLKRPEIKKIMDKTRSTKELGFVDEIVVALSRDRLSYGFDDVSKCISEANIKSVFVSEDFIIKTRDEGKYDVVEKTLKAAETVKAGVHILSTEDAKDKINNLGGIVAIKRW